MSYDTGLFISFIICYAALSVIIDDYDLPDSTDKQGKYWAGTALGYVLWTIIFVGNHFYAPEQFIIAFSYFLAATCIRYFLDSPSYRKFIDYKMYCNQF